MKEAFFSLSERDLINEFLDFSGVSGRRLSHICFSGSTEPCKNNGDKNKFITEDWTVLVLESGEFLGINLQGGMYHKAAFCCGERVDSWFSKKKIKPVDGNIFFPQAIGKRIASIGDNRERQMNLDFRVYFFDGSYICLNYPNEDFYHVNYVKTESEPLCMPLWEIIHTQYLLLHEEGLFTSDEINIQLEASGAFITYLNGLKETKQIREYREGFEKYYIYDVLPEDEFLKMCDSFDSEMTENSDYLLSTKPEYFRLAQYAYDLQRMTHRRPSIKHKWNYLRVTSKSERYRYYDACDNAFREDRDTFEITILKPDENGEVHPVKPTDYERRILSRNRADCSVISEEIAYKLAVNPALSY